MNTPKITTIELARFVSISVEHGTIMPFHVHYNTPQGKSYLLAFMHFVDMPRTTQGVMNAFMQLHDYHRDNSTVIDRHIHQLVNKRGA